MGFYRDISYQGLSHCLNLDLINLFLKFPWLNLFNMSFCNTAYDCPKIGRDIPFPYMNIY